MSNKIYCEVYRDRVSDGQRVKVGEVYKTVGASTWEGVSWYIAVDSSYNSTEYYYTCYDSNGRVLNL